MAERVDVADYDDQREKDAYAQEKGADRPEAAMVEAAKGVVAQQPDAEMGKQEKVKRADDQAGMSGGKKEGYAEAAGDKVLPGRCFMDAYEAEEDVGKEGSAGDPAEMLQVTEDKAAAHIGHARDQRGGIGSPGFAAKQVNAPASEQDIEHFFKGNGPNTVAGSSGDEP